MAAAAGEEGRRGETGRLGKSSKGRRRLRVLVKGLGAPADGRLLLVALPLLRVLRPPVSRRTYPDL